MLRARDPRTASMIWSRVSTRPARSASANQQVELVGREFGGRTGHARAAGIAVDFRRTKAQAALSGMGASPLRRKTARMRANNSRGSKGLGR